MQRNSGNTLGVIQNQSPKSKASAANANPVVKAENAQEAAFLAAAFKEIPLGEKSIGLTPVTCTFADGVNVETATVGDYIYDPLAPTALNLLAEWGGLDIAELQAINRPLSGAKIKPIRLPSQKLKCFFSDKNKQFQKMSPQDQQKYLAEYNNQLKRQQDAINDMSAEEFLNARKAYQTEGRNKLSQQIQTDYRTEKRCTIERSIYRSLKTHGLSASYVKKRAEERVEEIMKNRVLLHESDNEMIKDSHITSMDKSAEQAVNNKLNSVKMNIELQICQGKGE